VWCEKRSFCWGAGVARPSHKTYPSTEKHKIRLISYNVKYLVSSSCVDTVISVSAFSRLAILYSKQPRGQSSTKNTEKHKSGLIAYNIKHNPHSTTLSSHLMLSLLYNCRIYLRKLPPLSSPSSLLVSLSVADRSWLPRSKFQ